MLIVAGAVALPFGGPVALPDLSTSVDLVAATLVGVIAYHALTGAMRLGEISVVAPFRYTRLIFAMILGVVVFNESPDAWTLAGSAVIVISGAFTLLRSNRTARAS
jgi:drug/metabolite transporter (DMT)-like permease